MLSRRQTLAGGAGFLAALAAASRDRAGASRPERRVPYGACVNIAPLQDEAEYRAALESYCQQVIPEYGLYWDYLRPTRDQFNFDYGDKVLAFAEANEMLMRGLFLVEHSVGLIGHAEAERIEQRLGDPALLGQSFRQFGLRNSKTAGFRPGRSICACRQPGQAFWPRSNSLTPTRLAAKASRSTGTHLSGSAEPHMKTSSAA